MIQKITTEVGEVSYFPERGGIITSLKLKGKDIFYLDQSTIGSTGPVRGGIPILFPNGGELTNSEFPLLTRHGFARSLPWQSMHREGSFTETLSATEETLKLFPYNFRLTVKGVLGTDGSFTITQSVENLEKEKPMPLSMGLHPYFKVSSYEKKNIKFNFDGGKEIEEKLDTWVHGGTVSVANPGGLLHVIFPGMGEIILNYSKEYERILVWSEEGKDFVCIEPVMRDPGGLVTNPYMVNPGEVYTGTISIEPFSL